MIKNVSKKMFAAALLVVGISVNAQARFDFQPPSQGYNETVTVQAFVNRSVMNETLQLRYLARLDSYYTGYEVLSVSADTRSNSSYRTEVLLIADGYVVASQMNPGYQINLYPRQNLVLDQNVRNLDLSIRGSTYIDVLYITLRRPYQGGNPQPPNRPPQRPPQQPTPGGTVIHGGQILSEGTTITSTSGQVSLVMQNDCNLVLYNNGRATWSSKTNAHQNCKAAVQTDGNLVVYSNNQPVWYSNTSQYSSAHMLLQNDGNLVIYHNGQAVWDANTAR